MSTYDKASLVLIPSGTKEGVVFSQKPTNGDGDFTFSRATAATRVNADGLIEKETQNLLFPSEGTTTGWIATGIGTNTSSILTGQQDPNGGTQGYRWTATCGATTSDRAWYRKNITSGGEVYTFSFWVKSATGSDQNLGFHFSGGTGTPLTATSSWQRVERYGTTGAGTAYFGIEIRGTLTDQSADVYIYGMQLEYGLVARDYIETTTAAVYGGITDNVPRLDYTDSSCPSLLLEPQRTNLFETSEYFGTSSWATSNIGLTTNDSESIEGVDNATLIYPNSTSGGATYVSNATSGSSSKYTISAFVKADGLNVCWLYIASSAANGLVYFDLSDESLQVVTGSNSTPTGTITDMGDSWYRITCTLGSAQVISGGSGLGICDAKGSFSVTKSGEDGVLVYGLQLEEGSYATSYIPTYGTSVTRNVDACSKTGVSDLIGQTEGTLFAEVEISNNALGWILDASDGTTTNRTLFFKLTNNQIRFVRNSVTQSSSTSFDSPILSLGVHKIALAYQSGNTAFFIDGVQISTTNTATFTNGTLNKISLGTAGDGSGNQLGDRISQALLFKTRLTNAELEALTQV